MKHKLETQDPKAADEMRDGWEVLRTDVNTTSFVRAEIRMPQF